MKRLYEIKNLKELEDNVIKAKNNDVKAKEDIIEFFMPYINKTSKIYFIKNYECEDIKHFLVVKLLEAIKKYKYTDSFFWYAINTMKNGINNELKRRKREELFLSIDDITLCSDQNELDYALLYKEKLNLLKKSLLILELDDLKLIRDLFYLDKCLKELSKSMNMNYYTLASKKRRALNKLKKIYLSKY